MKILLILTSHEQLGNTDQKTGFWLEEFATPYYIFKDANVDITLASPKGGQPPLDPKSNEADFQTEATHRFEVDSQAQTLLAATHKLVDITGEAYDGIFYVGGHGPLWDLVDNVDSLHLIESMCSAGKPVAAVCHAPAVLTGAKAANCEPLVSGKKITGFSNSEEDAVGLRSVVPFLLEDKLSALGGIYSKGDDWNSYVLTDGNLITGQNPASSAAVAMAMLALLIA